MEEHAEKLFNENVGLAYKIAKKYGSQDIMDFEDVLQQAYLGLIKASNSFDDRKNVKFSTYACNVIENEIKMVIRTNNKKSRIKNACSIDSKLMDDADNRGDTLCDVIADENSFEDKLIDKQIVNELLLSINEKEKYVIFALFGFNQDIKTMRSLASIMSTSKDTVCRIQKKAIHKMRIRYDRLCGGVGFGS